MNGTRIKVVALNGSARKGGNTAILLKYVLKELESEGIETELIELSGSKIHGCLACGKCSAKKDRRCSQKNDMGNALIEKMEEADGILLGSPTYFANITPEILALMDRACYVSKANGNFLRRKVGAAVVAVRRAGAIPAFNPPRPKTCRDAAASMRRRTHQEMERESPARSAGAFGTQ